MCAKHLPSEKEVGRIDNVRDSEIPAQSVVHQQDWYLPSARPTSACEANGVFSPKIGIEDTSNLWLWLWLFSNRLLSRVERSGLRVTSCPLLPEQSCASPPSPLDGDNVILNKLSHIPKSAIPNS